MAMLQQIIDRRLAGQEQVHRQPRTFPAALPASRSARPCAAPSSGRAISDLEKGENISLPKRDVTEPVFGHGQGGVREYVHPGNKEYHKGDRIERPQGGGGARQGLAGRRRRRRRGRLRLQPDAGRVHAGLLRGPRPAPPGPHPAGRSARMQEPPRRLHQRRHAVQHPRAALDARRAGAGASRWAATRGARSASSRRDLLHLQRSPRVPMRWCSARSARPRPSSTSCAARPSTIPFIDPIDLRYSNRVKVPKPSAKAVMFCLMDVSGSMDEARKDTSKRFFILLYLFLTRHYEKIEVVFIRHHTQAQRGRRGRVLPRHANPAAPWSPPRWT